MRAPALHLAQVCSPIRTRSRPVSPQASCCRASCPCKGGPDGVRGAGEGGVDGVPHRLEHRAPVRLDRPLQEVVVAGTASR